MTVDSKFSFSLVFDEISTFDEEKIYILMMIVNENYQLQKSKTMLRQSFFVFDDEALIYLKVYAQII